MKGGEMKQIKGIKKSNKCWVRGDYDPQAAECRMCPSDGTQDFEKCQKIYQKREEQELAKIILKKKAAVAEAPVSKVKAAVKTTAVKAGKDARSTYVGKTFTHTRKGIKCEVVGIIEGCKVGTGVNVIWKGGELSGTKGTSSVNLLK